MNSGIPQLLIEKCRQNNREAQFQLYKQYCEGMFMVANRILNNTADAEDAMQEAFIKAFQKIEQYRGEVTFGAWLKKIVVNNCLDKLKADKKRVEMETLSGADQPQVENTWEVEDTISIEEIRAAILNLPEKYKKVVLLYLIEGYRHEEIAQILDISIISSRTQLRRGKHKLQVLLKQKCYGSRY